MSESYVVALTGVPTADGVSKVVYQVIAIRFDANRSRNWGWYEKLEDAITAVKENHTDLFERGWFNYALIQAMPEGLCAIPEPLVWFKASFVEEGPQAGNFIEAVIVETPQEAEGFFFT